MTGSLGRKSDCAVGKKPHVKSARVLVGEQHDTSKNLVVDALARQMMGGCKGAMSKAKWQGLKFVKPFDERVQCCRICCDSEVLSW